MQNRKESHLQTAVERLLRIYEKRGQALYIKNNSGAIKTEKRFVRFGKVGSSDFLLFMPDKTYFLECKSSKGRQTDRQADFQRRVERLGQHYQYLIIREVRQVYDILEAKDGSV